MDLLGELQRAEFKEAFDEFDKVCTQSICLFVFVSFKFVYGVVKFLFLKASARMFEDYQMSLDN